MLVWALEKVTGTGEGVWVGVGVATGGGGEGERVTTSDSVAEVSVVLAATGAADVTGVTGAEPLELLQAFWYSPPYALWKSLICNT